MNISKDWLPTPENINALPEPVKKYVHDLETNCDPQYTMQDLILTKDINKQLEVALITARADARAELLIEQSPGYY